MAHWSEATRGYSRHTVARKIRTITKASDSSVLVATCLPGRSVDAAPLVTWTECEYKGNTKAQIAKFRLWLLDVAMADPIEAYRIHRDHLIVASNQRGVRMTWREASIGSLLPFAVRVLHREGKEIYRMVWDADGRRLRRIWADIGNAKDAAIPGLISAEALNVARDIVDNPGQPQDVDPEVITARISDLIRMVTE